MVGESLPAVAHRTAQSSTDAASHVLIAQYRLADRKPRQKDFVPPRRGQQKRETEPGEIYLFLSFYSYIFSVSFLKLRRKFELKLMYTNHSTLF